MKKRLFFAVSVLCITMGLFGCTSRMAKLSLEQGNLAMASGDYQTALRSFKIAYSEGFNEKGFQDLIEILSKYQNAKESLDNGDLENAKTIVDTITNYDNYMIKDDIDKLIKDINDAISAKETQNIVSTDAQSATPGPMATNIEPAAIPAPQSTEVSLNGEKQKKMNTFLSNFSETRLYNYDKNYINQEDMISFAFEHNSINANKNVFMENGQMGISAEKVNSTLDKYMGIKIPLQGAGDWSYNNGFFYTGIADGECCDYFSVATKMINNGDGTYTVNFNTYYAEFESQEVTKSHYTYTNDTARNDPSCEFVKSGTAIVKDKVYNNKNTWELIRLYER